MIVLARGFPGPLPVTEAVAISILFLTCINLLRRSAGVMRVIDFVSHARPLDGSLRRHATQPHAALTAGEPKLLLLQGKRERQQGCRQATFSLRIQNPITIKPIQYKFHRYSVSTLSWSFAMLP